jgi:hypothetical protein
MSENYIQQLASYIKKNLAKGYTLDSLKTALEHQDYSKTSIERAIKLVNEQLTASAPQMKEKPVIRYEIVDKPAPVKKSFWKRIFGL